MAAGQDSLPVLFEAGQSQKEKVGQNETTRVCLISGSSGPPASETKLEQRDRKMKVEIVAVTHGDWMGTGVLGVCRRR